MSTIGPSRWAPLLGLVLSLGAFIGDSARSPVADAAMERDLDRVQALISEGQDVNAHQGDGMTALHWAAEFGDGPMAEFLLAVGANPEALLRNDASTPLHVAARGGHDVVARVLLDAGADPHASTNSGATPLHLAAGAGSAATIFLLADRGAEVDVLEHVWGQTPLIFAADFNRLEAVEALLALGANPAIKERAVNLPALFAVDRAGRAARNAVIQAFRDESGDPRLFRPSPRQVQAAADAAKRAQKLAGERLASQAVVPPLDEPRANDEEPLNYRQLVGHQGGLSALLHAAREGHRDVVRALLEGGADVNQVGDGERTTALLIATINGHFDLALDLLDRGADPNLADAAGTTPLFAAVNVHWAPRSRYPQPQAHLQQRVDYLHVIRELLEAGADPNARTERHIWYMSYNFDLLDIDVNGATAFWRAAYALDIDAMRLLMSYGADPTIPTRRPVLSARGYRAVDEPTSDPSGLTPVPVGGPGVFPIHAATGVGYGYRHAGNAHRHVPNGWLSAVKFLVEEGGADANARDFEGYSPVHHAATRGDNDVIRYLVSKGADVTVVSRYGQTTVDMANSPNQDAGGGNRLRPFRETIALLEGLGAINNHNCGLLC